MTIVLNGGLASISSSVAFTSSEVVLMKGALPAPGVLQAGTTIQVMAMGTISASASGTIQLRIRAGTAGTTADTQVATTGAIGAITTAVGWRALGYFTVVTVGAGGTCIGQIEVEEGTTVGHSAQTTTTAINTTVANFVDLTVVGAGTSPSGTAYCGAIVVHKS